MQKTKKGYVGRSMSINAQSAYRKGLKPLSKFKATDLRKHDFPYSLKFFKWMVKNLGVPYKERHHTSASYHPTCFYDEELIAFMVRYFDLPLLHQIYSGELTMQEAYAQKNYQYIRIRALDTILGGTSGKQITTICILYNETIFFSKQKYFKANDPRIQIVDTYDQFPAHTPKDRRLNGIPLAILKHKTTYFCNHQK